jgi:APA family basic amino acid/polyamine antiporter
VNIGTLAAFILVAIGVILLRRADPDRPRPLRTPLVPALPIVSVLLSVWLMVTLSAATWVRFVVWMIVGFFVYAFYSRLAVEPRTSSSGGAPRNGGTG